MLDVEPLKRRRGAATGWSIFTAQRAQTFGRIAKNAVSVDIGKIVIGGTGEKLTGSQIQPAEIVSQSVFESLPQSHALRKGHQARERQTQHQVPAIDPWRQAGQQGLERLGGRNLPRLLGPDIAANSQIPDGRASNRG